MIYFTALLPHLFLSLLPPFSVRFISFCFSFRTFFFFYFGASELNSSGCWFIDFQNKRRRHQSQIVAFSACYPDNDDNNVF
jgi:hypothetical protein